MEEEEEDESDGDGEEEMPKTKADNAMDGPAPGSDLPFTFPMPETPQQLEKIVGKLNAEDTKIVLDRIRKCHAPTLKEDNRKKTQTYFGLLLHRFEVLAGVLPLPVAHLDAVAANIATVAASVPFFCATAARARLEKMSARLRRSLRDNETGWPPARTLLLLALFADIFPTTDKQHPVTTPAALYLGNLLAHCAVRSAREAVTAIVAAALAAAYSAPAGRVFPEAVTLLSGLVHAAGVKAGAKGNAWGEGLPLHVREQVGGPWLKPDITAKGGAKGKKTAGDDGEEGGGGSMMSLASMLTMASAGGANADAYWLPKGADDRQAALHAAVVTLRILSKPAARTACASELLEPVQAAASRLTAVLTGTGPEKEKNKRQTTPPALTGALAATAAACAGLQEDIAGALRGTLRAPLAWRQKKADAIKQFNPMYEEEGYQKGRDYDPNRERAEARKLQRQLKQEARGAMRELRKDNRFLAEQRATEAAAAADERGEKQRETLAFLEKLEGDMKSGGQGGMVVKTQRRVNGSTGRDRKKR